MRSALLGLLSTLLCCQEALSRCPVALPFGVFLERIRHSDGSVTKVLAIHSFNGSVRGLKAVIADKAKSPGVPRVWVPHNLGGGDDDPEGTECVVEQLLVDIWVEVTDKQVGPHLLRLFVLGGLVDPDGLAIHLDHVEDLDGIVRILLPPELHKAVPLMSIGYPVLGQVDVHYGPRLSEQLPNELLTDLWVEVPHIDCGILITILSMLSNEVGSHTRSNTTSSCAGH